MGVLSKIYPPIYSTETCAQLGHTWTPSCSDAALGIFKSAVVESIKIYGPLFLIAGILKKQGLEYFKTRFPIDVIQSSLCIAVNASCFLGGVCLHRRILGRFYFLTFGLSPGIVAAFLAILVERKSRRGLLALYMFNNAIEYAYNILKSRGILTPLPYGEVLLFCMATSLLMYLYRKENGLQRGALSSLVRFLIGSEVKNKEQSSRRNSGKMLTLFTAFNIKEHKLFVQNWIRQSVRAFGIGYILQTLPLLLGTVKYIFKRPGRVVKCLYTEDSLKCGCFLGGFVAIFKAVEYILSLLRKQQDEWNGLVAGGISGLSMLFYRSSTIALYLASKISEVIYKRGIVQGYVPTIPYADILIYTLSTAFVFHGALFEVHNIRHSYWKYLNTMTHRRFCEVNRHRADELFGLDSAKLFPRDDLYKSLRS